MKIAVFSLIAGIVVALVVTAIMFSWISPKAEATVSNQSNCVLTISNTGAWILPNGSSTQVVTQTAGLVVSARTSQSWLSATYTTNSLLISVGSTGRTGDRGTVTVSATCPGGATVTDTITVTVGGVRRPVGSTANCDIRISADKTTIMKTESTFVRVTSSSGTISSLQWYIDGNAISRTSTLFGVITVRGDNVGIGAATAVVTCAGNVVAANGVNITVVERPAPILPAPTVNGSLNRSGTTLPTSGRASVNWTEVTGATTYRVRAVAAKNGISAGTYSARFQSTRTAGWTNASLSAGDTYTVTWYVQACTSANVANCGPEGSDTDTLTIPSSICTGNITGGTTTTTGVAVSPALSWTGSTGTYAWTATGAVTESGTGSTFSPAWSTTGTKTVSITVTCSGGGTATDTHSVSVTAHATPCAGSISGQTTVVAGRSIILSWSHQSGQGTANTYSWSESSIYLRLTSLRTATTATVMGVSVGEGIVTVKVGCTNGGSVTDTHKIVVTGDPAQPCSGSITGSGRTLYVGSTLNLSWTDSQGTSSAWSWTVPTGISGSSSSSKITLTGVTAGEYTVEVDVTCTNGGFDSDNVAITVEETNYPPPIPVITCRPSTFTDRAGRNAVQAIINFRSIENYTHYQWSVRYPQWVNGSHYLPNGRFTHQGNFPSGGPNRQLSVTPFSMSRSAVWPAGDGTHWRFSVQMRTGEDIGEDETMYVYGEWSEIVHFSLTPSNCGITNVNLDVSVEFEFTGRAAEFRNPINPNHLFRGVSDVTHSGTQPSTPSRLRWYRSTDKTIDTSDTELANDRTPGFLAGETREYRYNYIRANLPSVPGYYYYGACIGVHPDDTNPANNCSDSVLVYTDGTCIGEISGPTTVQVGSSITLTWTHIAGTPSSYSWTVPTGLSGTSTTTSITIRGVSAGERTVSINVPCSTGGTANISYTITVTASPCSGSISGPTEVSVNSTITLRWSRSQGSPSSYNWSESSARISISGSSTGSTVLIRGDSIGSGTISISVSCTNGGVATDTHMITVQTVATPCAGSITGLTAVRVGSNITLTWSHTAGQGTPSTYSWSESSTHLSIIGSSTGSTVSIRGVSGGTGTVSITVVCTNGGTATDSHEITVTTVATPCSGSITGQSTLQVDGSTTLTWNSGQGIEASYQWSENSAAIKFSGDTDGKSVIVVGVRTGNAIITIDVVCTNGGTATRTFTISIIPVATGPCDGYVTGFDPSYVGELDTALLYYTQGDFALPFNYPDRANYLAKWTASSNIRLGDLLLAPRTLLGQQQRGTQRGSVVYTPTRTGSAWIRAQFYCTEDGIFDTIFVGPITRTWNFNVEALPCEPTIFGPKKVSLGNSIDLRTDNNRSNNEISTYKWSVPSGLTITAGSTARISTIRGDTEGKYTVSVTTKCASGTSGTANYEIEVGPPCSGSIDGDSTITLTGRTHTLDWTQTEGTVSSYEWDLTNFTGSSSTDSIDLTVIAPFITGRVTILVTCTNEGTTTDTVNFVGPPCTGAIDGPASIRLSGRSHTLTWIQTLGTVESYTWTNTGFTGSSTTNKITVTIIQPFNTGEVSIAVICTNGGGATDKVTFTLPSCVAIIDGPNELAPGETAVYREANIRGNNTNWTWIATDRHGEPRDDRGELSIDKSTDRFAHLKQEITVIAAADFAGGATVRVSVRTSSTSPVCATATKTISLKLPKCAGAIIGPMVLSRSSSITLSWSVTDGTPSTYLWSLNPSPASNIWSSTSYTGATLTITAGRNFVGGTVSIVVTCDDGSTAEDDYIITEGPRPLCNGSVSGITHLEPGGSGDLILDPILGMGIPDKWTWTVTVGDLTIRGSANNQTVTLVAGTNYVGGRGIVVFECTNGGNGQQPWSLETTCLTVDRASIHKQGREVIINFTHITTTKAYQLWAVSETLTRLATMNNAPATIPSGKLYFDKRVPFSLTITVGSSDPQTFHTFRDLDGDRTRHWTLFIRRQCGDSELQSDWIDDHWRR